MNPVQISKQLYNRNLALSIYRSAIRDAIRIEDESQREHLKFFIKDEFRIFSTGVDKQKLDYIRNKIKLLKVSSEEFKQT